jgi:hypothetical protein
VTDFQTILERTA